MDVRCERCRAQYVFDDDQVTAAGLTVQCTNCAHVFRVKKKELVVTVPVRPDELDRTPLPATAAAPRPGGTRGSLPAIPAVRPSGAAAPQPLEPERAREWRVRQASGNIFTFRELTTLQKWIVEQKVSRDDEISLSGDQWKRLGNIAELATFFQVIEAAERSWTQAAGPALTPLPMPAVPTYGVALQTPLYPGAPPPPSAFPPPPPSGFPPLAFASPPPPAPEVRALDTAAVLPPVHEVDLGFDDDPPVRKRPRSRSWVVVLLAVVAVSAGAWAVLPKLLAPPPAPKPVAVQVGAPAPEPPPPPPAPPVPAPEPVAEPAPPPAPEPVKPVKAAPKGPKALLAQAGKLLENGDPDAALELYGRVASEDPSNAEAQAGRGLCYLDLENYAPAEASFLAALRIDPEHPDALLGLAETYRFQGKKAEAISHYEKYLARHPDGEDAEVAKHALAELRN